MKKLWVARDFDQWNDWDVIEPGNLTIYYDSQMVLMQAVHVQDEDPLFRKDGI